MHELVALNLHTVYNLAMGWQRRSYFLVSAAACESLGVFHPIAEHWSTAVVWGFFAATHHLHGWESQLHTAGTVGTAFLSGFLASRQSSVALDSCGDCASERCNIHSCSCAQSG